MRLYLVRHGETVLNLESRFQGWSDNPLSHRGEEQAREIADTLRTIEFDAAYSSTLIRAQRTAEIILEGRGMEVTPIQDFREHGIGELDGLKEFEIRERFPGVLENLRDDPGDCVPPGGESLRMVQDRVWAAFKKLAEKHNGQTILLVAHHSANKSLILKLLNAPLSTFKILRQPPCTVSILEMDDSHTFVHSVNLNWEEKVSPWHDLEDHIKERIHTPKAVIFDMDGVLLNSMPHYAVSWRGAMAEKGIFPPEIEFYRRESEDWRKSVRFFYDQAGKKIAESGYDGILERVYEIYYSLPPAEPLPGALELVQKLKKSGRKIAVVTGSPRDNFDTRFSDEQRALFDVVVTGSDVTNGKPHPEPYLKALDQLGVKASEALVVENAPYGIKSAKAAGITTVAFTSTLPRSELMEADLVVDSLSRLGTWMEG